MKREDEDANGVSFIELNCVLFGLGIIIIF